MPVRTRFAPSPTGFMHVGNLRTALYEYLIAKSKGGEFVLRIEDTDQERLVKGAVDVIYDTLKAVGLEYDEGPDKGGEYGPYIQSQRRGSYMAFAEQLIAEGKAYYCFCNKDRLKSLHEENSFGGYDRHCRDLSKDEVQSKLEAGVPFVIRQKMPISGSTTFIDSVFGRITVENKEIEDQILIKTDGYPTYNFANVIDDHAMKITHIVRGSEYLSSTPKYNLLYSALGWEEPTYVHLPLIMGKNEDGTTSKLSKRQGATSFEELTAEGYLPEAIVNYLALLGWCPNDNREIFSLEELVEAFSIDRISKSPSVFDYEKLEWFNSEYIKKLSLEKFYDLAKPHLKESLGEKDIDLRKLAVLLHSRVTKLKNISNMVGFLAELPDYDTSLYTNKKNKTDAQISKDILVDIKASLSCINTWEHDSLYSCLKAYSELKDIKIGKVMWPLRIAVAGKAVTPGGAVEILEILGKKESLNRIDIGIDKIEQ